MGAAGQQQQPVVSAEDATRGGAGGFFCSNSRGGATKPASPVPSPAMSVPVHNVVASAAVMTLFVAAFIFWQTRGESLLKPRSEVFYDVPEEWREANPFCGVI